MKRITKILLIVGLLLLLVIVLAPLLLVHQIYQESFGEPVETPAALAYPFDEFPDLNVEEFVLERDNNQDIYTFLFTPDDDSTEANALIVLAPGLGGATEFYTPLINYLVQSGYHVLSYDPSGHDKTADDDGFGSFSQGMVDADDILTHVTENHEDYADLPIVAMGHSWGGYSMGGSLEWHPEIEAAVLFAAFDRPGLLMDDEAEVIAGSAFATILKPYFRIYEFIRNSSHANQTVVDGVTNAEIPTLMLHSEDDPITDGPLSFDIFEEELSALDWVEIEVAADRGHSFMFYSEEDRETFAPFDTIDEEEIEAQSDGFERPSSVEIDDDYMTQVINFIEENIE